MSSDKLKNSRKLVLSPTTRLQLRKQRLQQRQQSLDWDDVRRRIESLNSEHQRRDDNSEILRKRAEELSRPLQTDLQNTTANTLVVLQCGPARFALDVQYVREITPVENITLVPGVPEFIVGVVNARGKILTLVNPERFLRYGSLNFEPANPDIRQSIVIVETEQFEFGLLCDGFPSIGPRDPASFKPVDSANLDYRTDYLSGLDSEGILLLNLAGLVNDPAFLVNQE